MMTALSATAKGTRATVIGVIAVREVVVLGQGPSLCTLRVLERCPGRKGQRRQAAAREASKEHVADGSLLSELGHCIG
eukprot:CAMPEP_0170615292 /NCGR_PEP_ID=MMETSP0224-20130122/25257_1 /TAXON_ID=285029 /ORGANISM="Togula jolla, Strain CCCM 725" /LENGTH=77 /DNA_ID=CAMNT_0010941009 /DNA_START=200 /DNA_END=429 /DNA_ORIENTATION=-